MSTTDTKPTTKPTTLRDVVALFGHLKSLNGREVVVRSEGGSQSDRTINEPYRFDGKTCYAIAKNLNYLKRFIEDFELARTKLLESLDVKNGQLDPKDTEKVKQVTEEVGKLLDEEVVLTGFTKIKLAGLKLDENAIQPGTIAALECMIDE